MFSRKQPDLNWENPALRAEVYALKMTTEWVGTSANADIPLTRNVRRYYIPSTTHGGGAGGEFSFLYDRTQRGRHHRSR